MEVLTILNQKGGVGKSTTAQCIAVGLKNRNNKVLLIDLDAQGNLTYSLNGSIGEADIMQVLQGADINKAIVKTEQVDLIASTPKLAGADLVITDVGKEYSLKEALSNLQDNYDYVVIDTPPAVGVLTVNALACADKAIIPAQADIYSFQGFTQLKKTIDSVKKYCNSKLAIEGILLTRYNNRAVISRDILQAFENIAEQLNTKVFNTKVRECISIKEAQASRQDIFTYAPKSNASIDYNNVIEEIINHG